MKKIIAVANQKGGVVKSSMVLSLGAGQRLMNYKVLFIDLDAQGNLSHTMKASLCGNTAFTVLKQRKKNIRDVIQKTPLGDCLCASDELSGVDIAISKTGKEYRLKEALEEEKELYDRVVIDTPPALGILTVNTLVAADDVIPSQADIYNFQGIQKLESNIESLRKYCNHTLTIAGILLTRFNGRCILSRDVESGTEAIAAEMNTKVFSTKIRECIAMKELQMAKEDIYSYDPKSNAAVGRNMREKSMAKKRYSAAELFMSGSFAVPVGAEESGEQKEQVAEMKEADRVPAAADAKYKTKSK